MVEKAPRVSGHAGPKISDPRWRCVNLVHRERMLLDELSRTSLISSRIVSAVANSERRLWVDNEYVGSRICFMRRCLPFLRFTRLSGFDTFGLHRSRVWHRRGERRLR